MPTIPPWLDITPNTFLQSMQAGTAAGERARATDIAHSEAADRLRLAYDSLARKEEMASEIARTKQEMAQAAMQLRAQQAADLGKFREESLGLRSKLGEANLGLAQQRIDASAERLKSLQNKTPGELITQEKNGETYQWGAGGWHHVPKFKPAMDTETTIIPGTEGKPAIPGVPAQKSSLLGIVPLPWMDKPAIPEVPAVPGTPTVRRTRRVPVDLSAGDSLRGAAPGTIPVAPKMPTFPAAPKDPKDRTAGQSYEVHTPKVNGVYTWTGKNWEQYQAPSHDESQTGDGEE